MPSLQTAIVVGVDTATVDAATTLLGQQPWRLFGTTTKYDPDRLRLDITDDRSVIAAVREVAALTGRIDAILLLTNGDLGKIGETDASEAEHWFQTNLVGIHRLTRAALPLLRARESARIIILTSASSKRIGSFGRAAGAALRAYLSELSSELGARNVRCALIEVPYVDAAALPSGHHARGRSTSLESIRDDDAKTTVPGPLSLARCIVEALETTSPALDAVMERRLRIFDRRRKT